MKVIKSIITGGAGFIGSNLTDHLVKIGHKVIILDNFVSGKKSNLSHHKKNNVSDYRIKSLAWASGSNNMEKALKKKPGYKIDLLKEELEREIKREEERKKIYK